MKTGKKGYGTQASPSISQKNTDIVSNIKSKYPKPKSNPSTLPLLQPTYPPASTKDHSQSREARTIQRTQVQETKTPQVCKEKGIEGEKELDRKVSADSPSFPYPLKLVGRKQTEWKVINHF